MVLRWLHCSCRSPSPSRSDRWIFYSMLPQEDFIVFVLGQGFVRVLWFSPVRIIPQMLHTYLFLHIDLPRGRKQAKLSKKQWSYRNRGVLGRKALRGYKALNVTKPKELIVQKTLWSWIMPIIMSAHPGKFWREGSLYSTDAIKHVVIVPP